MREREKGREGEREGGRERGKERESERERERGGGSERWGGRASKDNYIWIIYMYNCKYM